MAATAITAAKINNYSEAKV